MKYIIEQWKMGLTSKIIIYGHQLGSALALQLTSEYPNFVAGIILENPTSNLRPKDYKDTRISREIEFKSIIDQVSTVLDSTKEWDTTHMIPLIAFRADHQPQFAVIPNNQHDDLNPFENLTFIFDTLGIKASILNISTSKNEESGYHINGLEKFIAGLESKITCIDKD